MNDINWWPQDIEPSIIPLTLLSGPPGSGKSTSVVRGDKVLVIDFADIKAKVSGLKLYEAGDMYLKDTIDERNRLLRKLSTDEYDSAVFITNAPQYDTRKYWAEILQPSIRIIKAVDGATCMERISKDSTRETRSTEFWNDLVQSWWQKFNYGPGEIIHII